MSRGRENVQEKTEANRRAWLSRYNIDRRQVEVVAGYSFLSLPALWEWSN